MKKIIIILFLIIAQIIATPCFAETVECGKMEGVILNINNKYAPIDFSAEKLYFSGTAKQHKCLPLTKRCLALLLKTTRI